MPPVRLFLVTSLAMIAFAGNSIFCRLALAETSIDPASFTLLRISSGAITLAVLVVLRKQSKTLGGNWISAIALFAYAAGFSFAYVDLTAGVGALLLFGAVQATMIGYGLASGERLSRWQWMGLLLAIAGLVGLLLPGAEAPSLLGSVLMLGAGIAWGVYSLRGRGAADPTGETAGNFVRAVPMTILVSLAYLSYAQFDSEGVVYAVASGALASGLGYAVWYSVLPSLKAASAATVQLTVPAIAALGGVLFLGEAITWRLGLGATAILGGVALFILTKTKSKAG